MEHRRSEAIYARLCKLSVQDKSKALILEAARAGKSQRDLVRIVVKTLTKITTLGQAKEISTIWAPLLAVKPERFVEIAEEYLKD